MFYHYCKTPELIENYELAKADNFKGWHCHHRLETHNLDGQERLVFLLCKELKALNMYYNRPPEELIFMKTKDHHLLHSKGKHNRFYGKHHSEETKRKAVATRMSNGSYKLSEEIKKKISKSHKGKIYNDNRVRCQCIETGIIYESFSDAAKHVGLGVSAIRNACLGLIKQPRKFHWRLV